MYECIKQTLTTQFLVTLCSEGDNSVDADRMASRALEMIDNAFNTGDFLMPTNDYGGRRRRVGRESTAR